MRPDDTIYEGVRFPEGTKVTVLVPGSMKMLALRPRFDLRNHSPDGFEWGYEGSGPAQLALALLCDATGDDDFAQKHYQDFKRKMVGRFADTWTVNAREIRELMHYETQSASA